MASRGTKLKWDATMAQMGVVPAVSAASVSAAAASLGGVGAAAAAAAALGRAPKRASGRVRKISKSMKRVDIETRNSVRDARLEALQADNFNEEDFGDEDDDLYDIDADYGGAGKGKGKAKGKGKGKGPAATKRKGGKSAAGPGKRGRSERVPERVKPLEQIILEAGITAGDPEPNYVTAAVGASSKPARHLCSVCGFMAPYTCRRCGARFCSIGCNTTHKEDKCLKFG